MGHASLPRKSAIGRGVVGGLAAGERGNRTPLRDREYSAESARCVGPDLVFGGSSLRGSSPLGSKLRRLQPQEQDAPRRTAAIPEHAALPQLSDCSARRAIAESTVRGKIADGDRPFPALSSSPKPTH